MRNRTNLTIKLIICTSLILGLFSVTPPLISSTVGATLFPASSFENVYENDQFMVDIKLNTGTYPTNAYEVTLYYPVVKLEARNISIDNSLCDLWIQQPEFNNTTGVAHFMCGSPISFSGNNGLLASLTFEAIKLGTAAISIESPSQVLAADGMGTEVLATRESILVQILQLPKESLLVASDTHPDSNQWYAANTVNLSWEIDTAAFGYSYLIDQAPDSLPNEIFNTTETMVTFDNLPDGVWYFHLRGCYYNGLGETSHFPIHIDTTPPNDLHVDVSTNDISHISTISFHTTDTYAGIDYYAMSFNHAGYVIQSSPFFVENPQIGTNLLLIKAVDHVGNEKTAAIELDFDETETSTDVTGDESLISQIILILYRFIANIIG